MLEALVVNLMRTSVLLSAYLACNGGRESSLLSSILSSSGLSLFNIFEGDPGGVVDSPGTLFLIASPLEKDEKDFIFS